MCRTCVITTLSHRVLLVIRLLPEPEPEPEPETRNHLVLAIEFA